MPLDLEPVLDLEPIEDTTDIAPDERPPRGTTPADFVEPPPRPRYWLDEQMPGGKPFATVEGRTVERLPASLPAPEPERPPVAPFTMEEFGPRTATAENPLGVATPEQRAFNAEQPSEFDRPVISAETMRAILERSPGAAQALSALPLPPKAREFVEGFTQGTAEQLSGMTSQASAAMLPAFAIPYVGPALAGGMGAKAVGEGAAEIVSGLERGNLGEAGRGASIVAGGGLMAAVPFHGLGPKPPPIPPDFVNTVRRVDATVPGALPKTIEAAAKSVADKRISDQVQQLEKPIEKGIQDAETIRSDPGQVREAGRQPEVVQDISRQDLQQPAPKPAEPVGAQGGAEAKVPLTPEAPKYPDLAADVAREAVITERLAAIETEKGRFDAMNDPEFKTLKKEIAGLRTKYDMTLPSKVVVEQAAAPLPEPVGVKQTVGEEPSAPAVAQAVPPATPAARAAAAVRGVTVEPPKPVAEAPASSATAAAGSAVVPPAATGAKGKQPWEMTAEERQQEGWIDLWHGTTDETPFDTFKKSDADAGIHFGTREQAEQRVATKVGKRLIKAYIKPENILEVRDVFGTPSPEKTLAKELQHKGVLTKAELDDFLTKAKAEMDRQLDLSKVEIVQDRIRDYPGYESLLDYTIKDSSGKKETITEGIGYGNLKDRTAKADAIRKMVKARLAERINREPLLRELESRIEQAGYDVLSYRNAIEGKGGEHDYSFAILDPSKIKMEPTIAPDLKPAPPAAPVAPKPEAAAAAAALRAAPKSKPLGPRAGGQRFNDLLAEWGEKLGWTDRGDLIAGIVKERTGLSGASVMGTIAGKAELSKARRAALTELGINPDFVNPSQLRDALPKLEQRIAEWQLAEDARVSTPLEQMPQGSEFTIHGKKWRVEGTNPDSELTTLRGPGAKTLEVNMSGDQRIDPGSLKSTAEPFEMIEGAAPPVAKDSLTTQSRVFLDKDSGQYVATVFDERFGNMNGTGSTPEIATTMLNHYLSEARKYNTQRSVEHPEAARVESAALKQRLEEAERVRAKNAPTPTVKESLTVPTLKPGEKGTGDLLKNVQEPIKLAAETGVDVDKAIADKAAAETAKKEAALLQAKQQLELPGTNTEAAKKIADKIRDQFKTDTGGRLFLGPAHVINAAVEVVARAIEQGGKVADAIAKGVEYIKARYDGPFDEAAFTKQIRDGVTKGINPEAADMPGRIRSQVFGEPGIGHEYTPESVSNARAWVKLEVFDGDRPVSEAATAEANKLLDDWINPSTSRATGDSIMRSTDSVLGYGETQIQLLHYALKLAAEGKTEMVERLIKRANEMAMPGIDTMSEAGRALRGRTDFQNPLWTTYVEAFKEREGIVDKVFGGKKAVDETRKAVDDAKVSDADKADIEKAVDEAASPSEKEASRILDKYERSQTEWMQPEKTKSEVRKVIADAIAGGPTGKYADRVSFLKTVGGLLENAGVPKEIADRLAFEVWKDKLARESSATEKLRAKEAGYEQRQAQSILDAFITDQTETVIPQRRSAVRELIKNAVKSLTADEFSFRQELESKLKSAGVNEATARDLSREAWGRKEAIRAGEPQREAQANIEKAQSEADSILDKYAKSQSDTLSWRRKNWNTVREVFKGLMNGDVTEAEFRASLEGSKIEGGTIDALVGVANRELEIIRQNTIAENRQALRDRTQELWKQELERNQTAAENMLHTLEQQNAGAEWVKPSNRTRVREIAKAAMKDTEPVLDNAEPWVAELKQQFLDSGVDPATADALARNIEQARRKAWVNARERQNSRAANSPNVTALIDAIEGSPLSSRTDPAWRKDAEIDFFLRRGLSREQANRAQANFDRELSQRWAEARVKAAERSLHALPEWQRIEKSNPTRARSNLARIQHAIRAELTNPGVDWETILAKDNGWKGFSKEQHVRMAELDTILADPLTDPHQRVRASNEMMDIARSVKMPPTRFAAIAEGYAASMFSGLPTANVNIFAPPLLMVRNLFTELATNPAGAGRAFSAFGEAMKTFKPEFQWSWLNDSYAMHTSEYLKQSGALKSMMEEGVADIKAGRGAKGAAKVVYGAQQFVFRTLSSLDQSWRTVERQYKTELFSSKALKDAGYTKPEINRLVEGVVALKRLAYEDAIARGMTERDAQVRSHDAVINAWWDALAEKTDATTAREIEGAAQRESDMVAGLKSENLKEMDEGMTSKPFNKFMEYFSHMLVDPNPYVRLGGRMMFGVVNVPFRALRYGSNFSPYGLVRYAVHKGRESTGRETYWKQSFGNERQAQQRLAEAVTGTALMAILPILASATSEDDDKNKFGIYVTGKGPSSSDKIVRDAWLKKYRPYSIIVKVDDKYGYLPLGRIGESVMWSFAMQGALDDYALKQKHNAGVRKPKELEKSIELAGGYLQTMSQRGIFSTFQRLGEIGSSRSGQPLPKAVGAAAYSAGPLIPYKGMMDTATRLFSDPIDRSKVSGAIVANVPIAGGVTGKPAINALGDPIDDRTFFGKVVREGLPVAIKQADAASPAYDLIMQFGQGPTTPSRTTTETMYGPLTNEQWYQYSLQSGKAVKKFMEDKATELGKLDPVTFNNTLSEVSMGQRRIVANQMGLKPRAVPARK